VLEALRDKGLFPKPEQQAHTPAEKKHWARLIGEARDLATQARLWRLGKIRQLEEWKKLTYKRGPWFDWIACCRELYLIQTASGATLTRMYMESRDQSLAETREFVKFGRSEEAADRRFCAIYVAFLATMTPEGPNAN
jgi:hypothetical protein